MKEKIIIEIKPKDLILKVFAGIGIGVVVAYVATWIFHFIAGLILLFMYARHYG